MTKKFDCLDQTETEFGQNKGETLERQTLSSWPSSPNPPNQGLDVEHTGQVLDCKASSSNGLIGVQDYAAHLHKACTGKPFEGQEKQWVLF